MELKWATYLFRLTGIRKRGKDMLSGLLNTMRAEKLFSRGQKYASQGDYQSSVECYSKALSINPEYGGIYLHKALSLASLKKYIPAIEDARKAIELESNNNAHYLFLGIICFDCNKYDDALTNFNRCLELCPHNYLALCYKNLVYLTVGVNEKESLENIRVNIRSANTEFQARFLVKCESFLYQNRDKAKSLEDCLEDKKESTGNTSDIPGISVSRQISISMEEFFRKMIGSRTDKKKAYHHLLEVKKKYIAGDIDSAVVEYGKYMKYGYEHVPLTEKLIDSMLSNNQHETLWKLIRLLPCYNDISCIVTTENITDIDDEKMETLCKNHLSIIATIARLYFNTEQYGKAYCILSHISKTITDSYYVLYYCGMCKIALNDYAEARNWFQRALELINPQITEKRLEEMKRIFCSENIQGA